MEKLDLVKAEGLWFGLNKGTVSFSKDKDEVTVRFLMTNKEWEEISNYFSENS